jgi:hypothetical protein
LLKFRGPAALPPSPFRPMDDKQLQKLIRQNAARVAKANAAKARDADGRRYDPTLPAVRNDDEEIERAHFFSEMKKREF